MPRCILLRIYLPLSVAVAGSKRTHSRSHTVSQDRLNGFGGAIQRALAGQENGLQGHYK